MGPVETAREMVRNNRKTGSGTKETFWVKLQEKCCKRNGKTDKLERKKKGRKRNEFEMGNAATPCFVSTCVRTNRWLTYITT
jgi:hypothetical protein